MPAWPDKWDGLDTFEQALRSWEVSAQLPADVVAHAERWINSRQDNPYDSDPVPQEGLFDDVHTVRAWLRDLHLKPITVGGGYAVCLYEIHEIEHRLNCLYFTTRAAAGQ